MVDTSHEGFVGCAWAALVAVSICGGIVCSALLIFALIVRYLSGAY